MYHCRMQLYLMGPKRELFDPIRESEPLGQFTHTFLESVQPDPNLAAKADVIFADLRETDAGKTVQTLAAAGAELILLAEREQLSALAGERTERSVSLSCF